MSTVTYTAAQLLAPESQSLFNDFVCLLNLSFAKDPTTNWFFKNFTEEKFLEVLTYYHRAIFRLALLSGARVIAIREDNDKSSGFTVEKPKNKTSFKAMSILIPPSGNKTFESTWTQIRAGMLSVAWHAGFGAISRLSFEFVPKLNKMVSSMYPAPNEHRKHDQWHLLVLAARPDCQGQGLGKTIMLGCQGVVKEAALKSEAQDEYVSPLYLESSTAGSKRLYNRMGFVDRGVMEYGVVKESEIVSIGEDGKVSGAKLFALMWTP